LPPLTIKRKPSMLRRNVQPSHYVPMAITLYGIHPVLEVLKKRPRAVHEILLSRQREEGALKEVLACADASRIQLRRESPQALSRITATEQHQGVAARVEPFPLADLEAALGSGGDEKKFILVLDSIQDPHNAGALIRSAVCSGVQAVVFPKDRSAPLSGATAKAAAGALEHIPLCRVVNIAATLDRMKDAGIWIAGTSPRSPQSIYAFDFNLDLALVIGSEGKGMRQLVERKCDFRLAVPLRGPLDSLNASAAGAVILFEAMRQRRGGGR